MPWFSRLLGGFGIGRELRAVLAVAGPARCERAVELFRRIVERRSARQLHRAFEALELPLVEVLPDCPRELQEELRRTLEACWDVTRHRGYQKRIMDLRRSLIPDGA